MRYPFELASGLLCGLALSGCADAPPNGGRPTEDDIRSVTCAGLRLQAPRLAPTEEFPERCPVHDLLLRPARVPVQYGLLASSVIPEWRAATRSNFPYANTTVGGGCLDGPEGLAHTLY